MTKEIEKKDIAEFEADSVSISEVLPDDEQDVYEIATEDGGREKLKSRYDKAAKVAGYDSIEQMVAITKVKMLSSYLDNDGVMEIDTPEGKKQRAVLGKQEKLVLDYLDSIGSDMGYREKNNQFYIRSNVQKLGKKMFS